MVATRHAGIPEVVVDGETGFLVEERDVEGMARRMARLILEPELAAELGRAGRRRMQESFTIDSRIARLWEIIRASAPAWTPGWSVLIRPSIISGNPVRSLIGRTSIAASWIACIVLPVAKSS